MTKKSPVSTGAAGGVMSLLVNAVLLSRANTVNEAAAWLVLSDSSRAAATKAVRKPGRH